MKGRFFYFLPQSIFLLLIDGSRVIIPIEGILKNEFLLPRKYYR